MVGILFFAPHSYAGLNMCASGWGESSDNGTWVQSGTEGGKDYYVRGGVYLCFNSNTRWYLHATTLSGCTAPTYYSNADNQTTPDLTSGWVDNSGVFPPTGTIVSGDCITPTPTETGEFHYSTTTTVIDNPTQDIAIGIGIFLWTMYFVIWLFRRRV